MHQMRLTNKQIQDIIVDLRKQLKNIKTMNNALSIDFKFPKQDREKAKLIIEEKAWRKITALVEECDEEIAWHGTVTKDKDTYTITDIIVFPQAVTGCTVTSDETEYSLWLANQPDEIFNKLRFHGHSHVNMGTSPSGVDTSYQEDILHNLKDFYIFAIFNKKGDHWCAIYDLESNMAYDKEDIELITPDTEMTDWAKQSIKEYVKSSKNTSSKATPKVAVKKQPKKTITDEIMEDMKSTDGYDYYGYDYFGRYRYGQE